VLGVPDRPMAAWRWVRAASLRASERRLANMGYRPDLDVRKPKLLEMLPPKKVLAFANRVARFRDLDALPRLEALATGAGDMEGWTPGWSFAVPAGLDPDRALGFLTRIAGAARYPWRRHWLPPLLLHCSRQARETIRATVRVDGAERFGGEAVSQGQENWLDPRTIDAMLDRLQQLLGSSPTGTGEDPPVYILLGMLAAVHRLDCLRRFRRRAGSAVESRLADAACRWSDHRNAGHGSGGLWRALRVLLKIGGDGLTRAI
jgi:hypothetical protein